MHHISVTDNNCGLDEISETEFLDLQKFSDIPLKALVNKYPGILIYPRDFSESRDGLGEDPIFSLSENREEGKCTITTGNVMGFIGCGNSNLEITSRFTPKGNEDFFLHYMLSNVMKLDFNVLDLSVSGHIGNGLNLLMFMFPNLLKEAIAQGIYKAYKSFERNNAAIKGPVNISRHIKKNIPFTGKIAYSSREFSYDNPVLELIRHTIEFIKESGLSAILTHDPEIKECVNQIYEATPSYQKNQRAWIMAQNLRPFRHPLYTKYSALQSLCMMILRHENIKFSQNKNTVYGILFDGAWLWEEYLATILKKRGFKHPENKEGRGGLRMFINNSSEDYANNYRVIYPDFYKEGIDGCVLDAKYKNLDGGYKREDVYQLVTYMHVLKLMKGYFIYPTKNEVTDNRMNLLKGMGGELGKVGVVIPQDSNSLQEFAEAIERNCIAVIDFFNK